MTLDVHEFYDPDPRAELKGCAQGLLIGIFLSIPFWALVGLLAFWRFG